MSHHHGKTVGPICPKFCTQISGKYNIYIYIFYKAEEVRGGVGQGMAGRGGVVKLLLNFSKNLSRAG